MTTAPSSRMRRPLLAVVVVIFVASFPSSAGAAATTTPTKKKTTPWYKRTNDGEGGFGGVDDGPPRAVAGYDDGDGRRGRGRGRAMLAQREEEGPSPSSAGHFTSSRRRRRQQEAEDDEDASPLFPHNNGARANTKRGRGRGKNGRGRGWRDREGGGQQQAEQLGRQAAPTPTSPFGGFGAAIIPGPAPPNRPPSASTSTSTATAFLTPTADTRGKDPRYMYCGTSWLDASSACLVPCPGGGLVRDDECPGEDTRCYAGVTRCAHGGNGNDDDGDSDNDASQQQQQQQQQLEFHVGGGGEEIVIAGPSPVILIASDAFTLGDEGDGIGGDDGLLRVDGGGDDHSSVLLEFEIRGGGADDVAAPLPPRRPFSATLMLFVTDVDDGDGDEIRLVTVSGLSDDDGGRVAEVGNSFPVGRGDVGTWVGVNVIGPLEESSLMADEGGGGDGGGRLTLLLEDTGGGDGCTFASGRGKSTLAPRLVLSPYDDETMILLPSGDAYVRGGDHRDGNFGSEVNLSIKSTANESYRRRAVLMFDLGGLSPFSSPSSSLLLTGGTTSHSPFIAVLRLFVAGVGPSPSRTITVSRLPLPKSGVIDESTLSWANLDPLLATMARRWGDQFPVTAGDEKGWVEVDVTRLLRGGVVVDEGEEYSSSLVLLLEDLVPPTDSDSGSWRDFGSRESGPLSPQLVLLPGGGGGGDGGPALSPAPTRRPTTPNPTTSRPTTAVPSPKPSIPPAAADPIGATPTTSRPTFATTTSPPPPPPPTDSPSALPSPSPTPHPSDDGGEGGGGGDGPPPPVDEPFAAVPLPDFALVVFLRKGGGGDDLEDIRSRWGDGGGDEVMALMGATINHLTRLLDGGSGSGGASRSQKLQSLSLSWTPIVGRRRGRRRTQADGEAEAITNVTVVVGGTAYYEADDDDQASVGEAGGAVTHRYHVPDEAEVASRVHRAFEGPSMEDFASSILTGTSSVGGEGNDGGYPHDGGALDGVVGVRVAFSDGDVDGGGNGPSSAIGSDEEPSGGGGGLQRAMVPIGIVTAICAVVLILVLIAAKRRHNSLRTKRSAEGRTAGDEAFAPEKRNEARYGADYSTCYADGNDDYNYSLCSGIGGGGGGGTHGGGGASLSSCSFDTSGSREMHDLEDIEETIDKLQINVGEPGAPPGAFVSDVETTDEDGFTTSSCTSYGDRSLAPSPDRAEGDAVIHDKSV